MIDDNDTKSGIGILGGTFDPVHAGHLAIAEAVKKKYRLSRVHLVPAFQNPLRLQEKIAASSIDRLLMLYIATLDIPWLFVDSIEIDRGTSDQGPSYTVDTLRTLGNIFPGEPLTLIVGADNVAMHKWHQADEFPSWLERIVVVSRPGYKDDFENTVEEVRNSHPKVAGLIEYLPDVNVPVSSTDIRQLLANGEVPENFIHPLVGVYIRKYNLYGFK